MLMFDRSRGVSMKILVTVGAGFIGSHIMGNVKNV